MRRSAAFILAFIALTLLVGTDANARKLRRNVTGPDGCPGRTYSVVNSPDGTTLSILFDDFAVTTGMDTNRRFCNIQIPLNLPEGYSMGAYKVDYRGFARLDAKQSSDLSVDYAFGRHNKSRSYHRKIRGAYEGDFVFTENIGAGIMKRMGCGEEAVLNVTAILELQTNGQPDEATIALDSIDGAANQGLIYHFDLKKCGR